MGVAAQMPHVVPAAMRIMRALRHASNFNAIGDCPTVHSARSVEMRSYGPRGSEDVAVSSEYGEVKRTEDEIAKVERNKVRLATRCQSSWPLSDLSFRRRRLIIGTLRSAGSTREGGQTG